MSAPALPVLTKWTCATTCLTAYEGFCERFSYTGIWPATAQCLLANCNDKDRYAVQLAVGKYCDAVGFPEVWGAYLWAPEEDEDEDEDEDKPSSTKSTPTPSSRSSASSTLTPSVPSISSDPTPAVPQPTLSSQPNVDTTSPSQSDLPSNTTAPVAQSGSGGIATGAVIGIAVGITLFFLIIAVAGFFFWRWRRKQREVNFPDGPDHFATPTDSPTEKVFEVPDGDDTIEYTLEAGTLKRKKRPSQLSIKVV